MLPASPTLTPFECNPYFLTDHGFPALFNHLEYLAPRSSSLTFSSIGRVGGAPIPHHCSRLWCRFVTPARWNGLENGYGIPSERELSLCVLGKILSAGSRYILPLNTPSCVIGVVHPTPPHPKGGPQTTSGESGISCPPMELEFAPLIGPLRFAEIWGHFPWTPLPLTSLIGDTYFQVDLPRHVMQSFDHLRGT